MARKLIPVFALIALLAVIACANQKANSRISGQQQSVSTSGQENIDIAYAESVAKTDLTAQGVKDLKTVTCEMIVPKKAGERFTCVFVGDHSGRIFMKVDKVDGGNGKPQFAVLRTTGIDDVKVP